MLRISFVSSLYDVNNDGCITREEMTDVISAIYDLMGASHTEAGVMAHEASKDHVDRIFKVKTRNFNFFAFFYSSL
jgi:Ca2+-binding EF-hand superfamily protein